MTGGFVHGIGLIVEATRLLRREPALRLPALAPFLISATALACTTAAIATYAGEIYGVTTSWMPWPEAVEWYAWLWIAPLRVILGAAGLALFALAATVALVLAFVVAGLAASPFHDLLSRRVERVVTGGVVDVSGHGVRGLLADALRVLGADLQRVLLFLALQAAILLVGLIPGAQIAVGPALVLVTIAFLPLEYASFALDRRGHGFRAKLAWLRQRRAPALGFGTAACLLCALPLLNLAALPILVIAGTLLVVRDEEVTAAADIGRGALE